MSIGSERLTSNAYLAFPFQDDNPGLEAAEWLKGLLVDACLDTETVLDARLLEVIVTSGSIGMLWSNSIVITIESLDAAQPYTLFTWSTTVPESRTLRVVVHTANAMTVMADSTLYGSHTFDIAFSPGVCNAAVLGVTAIDALAGMFGSITDLPPVIDLTTDPSEMSVSGKVRLGCGYNMELTTRQGTTPDTTEIVISALPSSGMGKTPCTPVTGTPGTLHPDDNGNLQLDSPGDCYSFQLIKDPDPNADTLDYLAYVTNDCTSCCTCDDYAAVLAALRAFNVRLLRARTRLLTAHTTYQYGVTWYNAKVNADLTPKLEHFGMRGARYKDPIDGGPQRGAPNYTRWVLRIGNPDGQRLNGTTMVIKTLLWITLAPPGPVPSTVFMDDCTAVLVRADGTSESRKLPITKHTISNAPAITLKPGDNLSITIMAHTDDMADTPWKAFAQMSVRWHDHTWTVTKLAELQ